MRPILRLLAFMLLIAGPACADPAPSGPPAKPLSLADSLKALSSQSLPQDTLILSVGAEGIWPARRKPPAPVASADPNQPEYIPPPPDPSTLDGVLAIFNQSWQTFGKVAAVAPAEMTVLNVDPDALSQIDPVALASGDAMKILLGSLTKAQWQEIASAGLAIGDLDEAQTALFRAAVRAPFKVVPSTASWNPPIGQPGFNYQQYQQDYESRVGTVTPDMLAGAQLEAHLATMYLLPVPNRDSTNQEWLDEAGGSGIAGVYQISSLDTYQPDDNPLASMIRADLPNTLKPGNLNWNSRPLGASVPLDSVKTVGDLVGRIARATGLELYCDPHYASRSVLILDNTGRPQRARDLLQGLCVCVCGAWRQVGPAYVLTDDVAGLAARRTFLKAIANTWSSKLGKLTDAANNSMIDQDWYHTLQFMPGDPNALSPDQMKSLEDKAAGPNSGNDWLDITFSQLPSATQSTLKDQMGKFVGGGDGDLSNVAGALAPGYKMDANLQVRVFLDVPSLGLVALDTGSFFTDVSMRKRNDHQSVPPPSAGGKPAPPATLPADTTGVLCAPRNADEARSVVDKMASMGFHLLYCDVFTNGKAYIANPLIPPGSADAAAVLPAAIAEGKAKGVKVFAMIDTFAWGKADAKTSLDSLPIGVGEDQTITLEAASDAMRQKEASMAGSSYGGMPTQIVQWVSPSDPAVQGALMQMVNAIARTPGLAGLAFEDTAPPSYLDKPNTYDPRSLPLGYTLPSRLAFLRAHHADPVDFGDDDQNMSIWVGNGIGGTSVELDIPSFDGNGQGDAALQPAWEKARQQADSDAMARLYWSARGVNPSLPLYLRSPSDNFTFSPWTDPVLPFTSQGAGAGFDLSRLPPGSHLVLPWVMMRANMGELSYIVTQINTMAAKAKTPVGMVFDLVDDPSPDGPVRDLEVISEHVRFVQTAPAQDKPAN